jgi:urate oxidase
VIELGPNRYGKSAIRVVKLIRGPDRHELRDLTVAVALEGDFEAAHTEGDNSSVVATDTMKNTVYAFAKDRLSGSIEAFGRELADHFAAFEQVSRATVTLREHGWRRIDGPAGPADDAFLRTGELTRTATVRKGRNGPPGVEAGIEDLTVMKTTKSAFTGFPRDRHTTLPEADDRILATKISATWRYETFDGVDFDASFDGVRATLLGTFADHFSPSVQSSIWVMGRAILERHAEIAEVRMVLPNLHHWVVDMAPFGLLNERDVFIATTEPYGLIEATVRRGT